MLKQIQRHPELGNQEYKNYIQPANQDIFEIFNDRISKFDTLWFNKNILDFGCNIGHLLTTSDGKISPCNYTGVDINFNAISIAKNNYPNANWIHYNGYNLVFNPNGIKNNFFKIDKKFDYIIAYGVFTHYDLLDIKNQIKKLKFLLNDNGILLFSIWEDTHFKGYLNFLKNAFNISLNDIDANIEIKKSLYLINRKNVILDKETTGLNNCTWLETFYKKDYFLKKIKGSFPLQGIYTHHSVFGIKK